MLRILYGSLLKVRDNIRSPQPIARLSGAYLWRCHFGAIPSRRPEPLSDSSSFVLFAKLPRMSQAKISAFFRKKDESVPSAFDTSSESTEADSPVKAKIKRKSRIVSSDSEDDAGGANAVSSMAENPKENRTPSRSEPSPKEKANRGMKRKLSAGSPKGAPSTKRVSTIGETAEGKKESKTIKKSPMKPEITGSPEGEKLGKAKEEAGQQGIMIEEPLSSVKVEVASPERKIAKTEETPQKKSPKKNTMTFGKPANSAAKTNDQYYPDKASYDAVNDAAWKKDEKIPYLAFCRTLECIDENSSRLKMIEILCNFFRSCLALSPNDLVYAVYLCLNKIAPDYEGKELGIGDSLLMKAVAEVTGRTLDAIRKEVHVKGDLGSVAEASKSNQKMIFAPPKLLLCNVFNKLKQIAQLSGHSVQTKKVDMIKSMFVACRGTESKFLIRSLTGKLRIGLAESSLLTALAHAIVLHDQPRLLKSLGTDSTKKILEEATLKLKTVYCECPNYDKIIEILLNEGFEALPEKCKITPGVPMKPMLAHPTKGVADVLKRFENMSFTCEFKYDGERAQIHMTQDKKITIFSRNQENNTTKYPDIIDRISKNVKDDVTDFIMDSEAVAYDREKKQILPFQTLMHRKKKDVDQNEITIQVYVFAFDLLYLNGRSLVREPFRERRRLLKEHFNEVEAEFGLAQNADLDNVEEIQEFLEESIKGNCEGLMVKTLDNEATYEIAKRSHNWLKLKKDYLEGVGDTIDVVVIGGWKGKGKRTGTYGGFLLACYDPESEEFQSLCKIGTGFKEEELEQHSNFFKNHVLDKVKAYYNVDPSLQPDEWFDAVQVWEIKCADLSISPIHKAAVGMVDPEKGISLRFPRFIRIRDDKSPEDATSAEQIATMYRSQDQIKNQGQAEEEDFY